MSGENAFQLVPVPTRPPARCSVCSTQSEADGPFGEAVAITTIDGTPAVCRRCMVGLLRLSGAVSSEHFADTARERDEAREERDEARCARDDSVAQVQRLELDLESHTQEIHDLTRILRDRDAQIRAAREGRLNAPDIEAIKADVKAALLEQPEPKLRLRKATAAAA